MRKVALLEGREVLSEDRFARADLCDVRRRRELQRHFSVQMHHRGGRGGVEQDPLIREILATIDHRAVLPPQFAVLLIERLVHRTTSEPIDRQVQELRRRVDVDAARLHTGEAVLNDQVPAPRGGTVLTIQRRQEVLQGHLAPTQGDGDAIHESHANA